MEKILISSCLLGHKVRYDGGGFTELPGIIADWQAEQRLIPLCPEMAGGLGCPRPAAEIQGGQGDQVLKGESRVLTIEGADVTAHFIHGARAALACCQSQGIRIAILKARSPSCGHQSSYDGSFTGSQIDGQGVTAALLRQQGIQVFDETELEQAQRYLQQLEQRG